jgi:hypothetical protein
MKFRIPIRLPSLANMRSQWEIVSEKKQQKLATFVALKKAQETEPIPSMPLVVTITRIGPRKLDDDNLAAACKYVRDQIAKEVGVDDGSDQYTWMYKQRNGGSRGYYAVDVEIETRR